MLSINSAVFAKFAEKRCRVSMVDAITSMLCAIDDFCYSSGEAKVCSISLAVYLAETDAILRLRNGVVVIMGFGGDSAP